MRNLDSPFVLRLQGTGVGGVHRLSRHRTVVGRSRVGMPDVEIFELEAAPRHCVLDWDEQHDSHVLTVCGINGLRLNNELVFDGDEPRVLLDGDQIRIGATTLVYAHSPQNSPS